MMILCFFNHADASYPQHDLKNIEWKTAWKSSKIQMLKMIAWKVYFLSKKVYVGYLREISGAVAVPISQEPLFFVFFEGF